MTEAGTSNEHTNDNLIPRFFCNNCYNAIYGDEKRCPDCGKLRPGAGFPDIEKSLDPWLGRVIADRYFVNKRIGRGGTGSVYRIQHMPYGRTFAIKIVDFANLPADSPVDTLEKRLGREIAALRKLQSPHIVQLYEVLELPDNVVGVVMDYINGKTLDQVIDESGPLRPKRALQIMRQIAEGVCEAHSFDMIHRDLKPENIMVERIPGGDDFIHILDFGVVRMDDGLRLTQGFLGTPLYASPEQSMAREVDARSDIYSLGGILFYTLTGTAPFNYESIFDILQAHAQAELPTLQERTNIVFPAEVEALIHSMLAKDPEDRPDSLEDVIRSIDSFLNPGVINHYPPKVVPKETNPLVPYEPPEFDDNLLETMQGRHSIRIQVEPDVAKRFEKQGMLEGVGDTESDEMVGEEPARKEIEVSSVTLPPLSTLDQHTYSPWHDQEVALLYSGIDQEEIVAISSDQEGRSLSFLMTDGQVVDIDWPGRLSVSPSTDPLTQNVVAKCLKTELKDVVSLYNAGVEYLFGTKKGAIYSLPKEGHHPLTLLFTHPFETPVTRIAASSTKFKRVIVAFENGDIYVSGDGIGQPKGHLHNEHGHDAWVRVFKEKYVEALSITMNGESFAIVDEPSGLGIYSFAAPGAPFAKSEVSSNVKESVFSQDGHVFALLRDDSVIELRHTISAAKLTTLHDPDHSICCISFGSNGGFIGYFIHNNELRAIDLQREVIRST